MSGKAARENISELPAPDSRRFRGFIAYEFLLRAPTRPPATQANFWNALNTRPVVFWKESTNIRGHTELGNCTFSAKLSYAEL